MRQKSLMRLFSFFTLICLLCTQVMPLGVASAAPNPSVSKLAVPAQPAAHPAQTYAVSCGGDPSLPVCVPDGSDTVNMPPAGIQVFAQNGTTATQTEPTNDTGGLTAQVGDKIRIPFAVALVTQACGSIPATSVSLKLNPGFGANSADYMPTFITPASTALTYDDGTIGPYSPQGKDTLYGYFDFIVDSTHIVTDHSGTTPGTFINFAVSASGVCSGSAGAVSSQVNFIETSTTPSRVARRIKIGGALFIASKAGVPDHVSINNTLTLPFSINNEGAAASFTISAAVTPTNTDGSQLPVTYTIGGAPATAGTAFPIAATTSVSGTVVIGLFPASFADSVSVTLTVVGTAAGASATQMLTWVTPVWHPRIAVVKSSDQAVYKAGDTITYTITINNIGQLPLTNITILDTLTGSITVTSDDEKLLAKGGGQLVKTTTYAVRANDTNPLPNTVTVNASWTPAAPEVGPVVSVYDTTTHQVAIESTNLDVHFVDKSIVPNYAKPTVPIVGAVNVLNTGTEDIQQVSGAVQLVDVTNQSTVYASAGFDGGTLPATVPAGAALQPTFTITLPSTVPTSLTGVLLVVTINGVSAKGITVNRKISQPLDVVFSNLHVIVSSDASTSGLVARGQIVHYTITVQNISAAPVTGVQVVTGDSLGLLTSPQPATPITLAAAGSAGDSFTVSGNLAYTISSTTPNPLIETVTAAFTGGTATGQSVLNISDVQVFVSLIADCTVALATDKCGDTGYNPITNNTVAITTSTIVHYSVLIQNVGQTTVTGVIACIGATSNNCQGDVANPPLTLANGSGNNPTILFTLGSPDTSGFTQTLGANTAAPYVQVVTVFVNDQLGQVVTFKGAATLNIVSPNAYWAVSKTTNVKTVFVGDTIVYTVKACYNGAGLTSPPPQLDGVRASDPFAAGDHFVWLSVDGATPNSTGIAVPLGKCAIGTYPYIADDVALADKLGPADLTNIVTFTTTTSTAATATQSATVQVLNPIQVKKTVNPSGPVFAGASITYYYDITNLSNNTISNLTGVDSLLTKDKDPFTHATPPLVSSLAPNSATRVSYTTTAPAISGVGTQTVTNIATISGTVGVTNVPDKASGKASIGVLPPLLMVKAALLSDQRPYVFIYDPSYTYQVTIANVSNANVKLINAVDTLGKLARPTPDGSILVTITHSAAGSTALPPARLDSITMLVGDVGVITYVASPLDLESGLAAGFPDVLNTFTLTAQVGADAVSGQFTISASTTTKIYQPLFLSQACPEYPYYGWGETAHWTFAIGNGSYGDANNHISLINIQYRATALGVTAWTDMTPNALPFNTTNDFQGRPVATAHIDYKIPWSTLAAPTPTSFDNVALEVRYVIKEKNIKEYFSFSPTDGGCAGVKIGPPLKVTKTPDKPNTTVGSVVTYTVKISNPMYDPADVVTNIAATDVTFGQPLTFTFPTTSGSLKPGSYDKVNRVIISSGESVSTDPSHPFTHTMKDTDPTPLINEVDVSGVLNNLGGNFPSPIVAFGTVLLPSPLVKVTSKAHDIKGNSSVDPGSQAIFDVTIENDSVSAIKLLDANADNTDIAPDSPKAGLDAWAGKRGGDYTVPANTTVQLPALYKYTVPAGNVTNTKPITSTITISYVLVVIPAPPNQVAMATATIDVNNPNLQVVLTSKPSLVVNYGQTVTYTEKVINPSQSFTDTNLSITNVFGSGATPVTADLSHWFDGSNVDVQAPIDAGTYQLLPGGFIQRTVTHLVITGDQSPLTFTVTASAQYLAANVPVKIADTKISSLPISSAQLLIYTNPAKKQVRGGDIDPISVTLTNIGNIPINQLIVTATTNDPAQPGPFTVGIQPDVPGSSGTAFLLQPLTATSGLYTVTLPATIPHPYPNPLIVVFHANGTTADGKTFAEVTTQVIIHVLTDNIYITESPNVSAGTVGSTVTYTVTVTNPGPDPLNITSVVDGATNQPVLLTFPGSTTPSAAGLLNVSETAAGETNVTIAGLQPNPFVHTTTANGTTAPVAPAKGVNVSDTSASQINVLGSFLNVSYSPSATTVTVGQVVTFTLTVTNTGAAPVTVSAKNIDTATPLTLKDSTGTAITSLAVGATANAVFTYTPTSAGSYTSHVEVDGADGSGRNLVLTPTATINITGGQMVFSQPPTPDKTAAAVGDTVSITFKLKNTSPGTLSLNTLTAACVSNPTCSAVSPALPAALAANVETPVETITYVVQASDTGTVTLAIQATAQDASTPPQTIKITANVQFNVSVGGLVITKKASQGTAKPGDSLIYTVTLQNVATTGSITVSKLTDSLVDLTGKVTLPITIAAATTAPLITYTYTVPVSVPGNKVNNTITATFTSGAQSLTATASVSVPLSNPALTAAVDPSTPTTGAAGGTVKLTFNITNTSTTGDSLYFSVPPYNSTTVPAIMISVGTGGTPTYVPPPADPLKVGTPESVNFVVNIPAGATQGQIIPYTLSVAACPSVNGCTSATGITAVNTTVSGTITITGGVAPSATPGGPSVTPGGPTVTPGGPGVTPKPTLTVTPGGPSTTPFPPSTATPAQSNTPTSPLGNIVVTPDPSNPTSGVVGYNITFKFTLSNPGTLPITGLTYGVTRSDGKVVSEIVLLPSTTLSANSQSPVTATFTHTIMISDSPAIVYTFTFKGLGGTGGTTFIYSPAVTSFVTVNSTPVTPPTTTPIPALTFTPAPTTTPQSGAPAGLTVTMQSSTANVSTGSAVTFTIVVTNTSTATLSGVSLTDSLPATLTGSTATSDTGTASVSGNVLTVNIGTLTPNQKATITFSTSVGTVTAPATITNNACATTSGNATSVCGTATLTVAAAVSLLPVTGMGNTSDGGLGGLFIVFALSSLLFFALAAGRNSGNSRTLVIAAGVIAGIVVLILLISIGSSILNRSRTSATATQIAVAAQPTKPAVSKTAGASPTVTATASPTATTLPGVTPSATNTISAPPLIVSPGASVVPSALFQPVGDKSVFVPKLGWPSAVPVVELPLVNQTWDVRPLAHNVGHLEETSWLGTGGNTVLVAHIQLNFQDMGPFQHLNQLAIGDQVYVADHGKFYAYTVTNIRTVEPTDVQVTYPTVDPILTLITCTIWDSHRGVFAKRLVVTAKQTIAPPQV